MALFNLGQGSFTPEASEITFDSFALGTENPVITFEDLPELGTVEVSFGTNFVGQTTSPLVDGVLTLSDDSSPEGPLALDSDADPVLTEFDGSANTNPVLSGTPIFNGPISVLFSEPVGAVGLTGGFFDAVESTNIEAFDVDGNSLGLVQNTQTGFEFFGLATDDAANDIAGISFYITGDEPAGFAIDNLTFGTIDEVDATVAVTADQDSLAEGSEGTTTYTFTVERNGSLTGETAVNYAVAGVGENAATEADFADGAFPTGEVTFAPDETEKTITVEVVGDEEVETDEEFEVTLSNVTGGAIGLPSASSIIQDDDGENVALEPNDILEQAIPTALSSENPGVFEFSEVVGNNPNVSAGLDVDLYEFDLAAGDRVTIDIAAESLGSNLDSVVQLFNEAGERVASNDDQFEEATLDSFLSFNPIFSGTYYAAVSGFSNVQYDVFTEGSGLFEGTTGEYDISIEVEGVGDGSDEPNDTFDNAIFAEISSEINSETPSRAEFSGNIGDNTTLEALGLDVDLYEVQLNAGDRLSATLDTIDLETGIDAAVVRILDNNGNEFLAVPSFAEQLSNVGSTNEFIADTSGTYFVGVSGFSNFDYDPSLAGSGEFGEQGDYNLSLEVSSEPSNEPNDTIPEAISVSEELLAAGEFSESGFIGDNPTLDNPNFDVDLYGVSLIQGESINIDLDTPDTSALDLILRVFNGNGGEIDFRNNSLVDGEVESLDPSLNFTAPFSGEYYIGVSDLNNDFYSAFEAESGENPGETGSYNIEITGSLEPENFEDPTNDTIDTAVTLQFDDAGLASAEGIVGDHPDFIPVPGLDVDLYEVALEENEEVAIEVAAAVNKSPLDSILRVFNSEGEEIVSNDDFNESDPFIQFTAETAGNYFLGVSGVANNEYDPNEAGTGNDPFASTGDYTLNVENFGIAPEPGPEEPNDTLENATATNLTPGDLENVNTFRFDEGAIGDNTDLDDPSLDVDIFSVELAADSLLTADINTEELDSDLDSVIQIFDTEGELITFNDDENGETPDSFLEFIPQEAGEQAGIFYVGVSALGNNGPDAYNPTAAGSGIAGGSQGDYVLELFLDTVPVEDPTNDTLETAVATGLNRDNPGSITKSGIIGDNLEVAEGLDVDQYKVQLKLGDELRVNVDADSLGSELDPFVRIFNSEGEEVAFDDDSGEGVDAQLTFTPDANGIYYVGISNFENTGYDPTTVGSDAEVVNTGEYEVTLNLTPGTPVQAASDEFSTDEDTLVQGNVLNNDGGEALLVNAVDGVPENVGEEVQTEAGALLSLNEDGTFDYNPNAQFEDLADGETVSDSFTYTVTDEAGQTGQATATIIITGVADDNETVDAIDDAVTISEQETLFEFDVLDGDLPAAGLSISAVNGNPDNVGAEIETNQGALVTLTDNGDGTSSLTYNPNGQFAELNQGQTATDSFTYTVTDGNDNADQATVTVTIEGLSQVDDIRPTANNDIAFIDSEREPVTVDVLANDTANDEFGGLAIEEFQASTSKGGTITLDESGESLVYTPDPDFSGEDSFTYSIANESGGLDQGTVNLNVSPSDPNVRVEMSLRELDETEGLVIGEEFLLDVSFQNLVTDDPAQSVTFGYADIAFDPTTLQIIEDDADIDDDGLSVNGIIHDEEFNAFRKGTVDNVEGIVDEVGGGVTTANVPPDDNRVFSLQMKAVGGGDTRIFGTTTVGSNAGESIFSSINILDLPGDQRDQTEFLGLELETVNPNVKAMEVTTRFQDTEGNPIESANVGDDFQIVLSAKDLRTEGDKLGVFSAFADVNYDTVLANVTEVSPAGDFNFPVNFDPNEAINDDEGLLDEIGGSNANFTPVASDEPQDFAIITATATAQGELEITPDVGDGPTSLNTLFGLDNDVNSGTDYFGESLSIAPPELTVQEDAVTTNEDATVEGNVVSNDDGLNLTVTAINGAETIGEEIQTDQGALVTLNADGTFSYNPNGQFEALIEGESQTDSFTYTVTDQVGQTDEATVTVTIEGTGVAADAIEDSITLEEGETRELDVLANDTGTEPLTVTEVAGSAENVGEPIETDSGALVTLAADGSLTYNTNGAFEALAQGETETDSFSYTITDDDGLTDQAEVNITINGVGAADLVVTSFDVTNDHVLGAEATVNFTVENQGEAASPGFQVELLYYTSNGDDEPLSEEDPEVVKTLSLGEEDFDSTELAAGEAVTATSEQVSLPIETLLAEALEDDPSIFGENLQGVESNNIDHLGIRIKDSVNSGESEETFGNNALNDTEGVNIDDITYFPWDFVNNAEDGYNPNEEDEIITDGAVTPTDATAVFRNIGLLINEDQTEGEFGADLERIDFDLDSAISPVDAVRVVNRLGYVINPDVIEGNEEADLNGVANDGLA